MSSGFFPFVVVRHDKGPHCGHCGALLRPPLPAKIAGMLLGMLATGGFFWATDSVAGGADALTAIGCFIVAGLIYGLISGLACRALSKKLLPAD